jgi:hypothetical protein
MTLPDGLKNPVRTPQMKLLSQYFRCGLPTELFARVVCILNYSAGLIATGFATLSMRKNEMLAGTRLQV